MKTIATIDTLSQVLAEQRKAGYTREFVAVSEGLKDLETGRIYPPEALKVAAVYRFEGQTDVSDEEALYLLEGPDGVKGWITDAFGPYADPLFSRHLWKMDLTRVRD